MEQASVESPKRRKAVRVVLEWMEELMIALVLIAVIFTFVCRVVTVTGTSMVPNFHEGDRVLVVNDWNGVEQGDVVVIVNVLDEPIIKRVIATEGQTVALTMTLALCLWTVSPWTKHNSDWKTVLRESPSALLSCWNFPKPCRKAACLFWGTTGLSLKTAVIKTWA